MSYKSYEEDSLPLNVKSPFFLDHVSRYIWAKGLANNKDVLDCATGKGYGAYIISKSATKVVGIDLNDTSLEIARDTFSKASNNLEYIKKNAFDASDLGQFDLITAFEIIEHIPPEETDKFISGLKQALKPGGQLIVSTPNHDVVLKSKVYVPEFHINNFPSTQLKKKLEEHFKNVEMLGQYRPRGTIYNLIFNFDFFNLRHVLKSLFKTRPETLRGEEEAHGEISSSVLKAEDFHEFPSETSDYKFSNKHWRQAGLSVAICTND